MPPLYFIWVCFRKSISSLLTTGIGLINSILLVRLLGLESLGLLTIAVTIVATIVQILDLRAEETLMRMIGGALVKNNRREAITYFYVGFGADVVLTIITLVSVLVLAPLAAQLYPQNEVLTPLIQIFAWSVPFSTLQNTFELLPLTLKRFKLDAAFRIAQQVILVSCVVIGATNGLTTAMWGYTIASILIFALAVSIGIWVLKTDVQEFRGENYRQALKVFLPSAFYTSIYATVKSIGENTDTLLIGALASPSAVSIFRIATRGLALLNLPIAAVRAAFIPRINEAWALEQWQNIRRFVIQSSMGGSAITFAGSVGLILGSFLAVPLLFGIEANPVIEIMFPFVVGYIITGGVFWSRPLIIAANRPELHTVQITFYALFRAVLSIPCIWAYGAVGAGISFSIAQALLMLTNVFWVMPKLKLFGAASNR